MIKTKGLSRKAKFLYSQLELAVSHLKKHKSGLRVAKKIEDAVLVHMGDKRSSLYQLRMGIKVEKPKQVKSFEKIRDPRLAACKKNGQKGGLKRAALHSKEEMSEWGRRAGTATLARYGAGYFTDMVTRHHKKVGHKVRKKQ